MIWLLPWGQDNRVKHVSWAVYALIVANVAVYVWMVMNLSSGGDEFFRQYGLLADDWRWYQFFTANFLHGGIAHLLGNMLFLWLFGDSIEDAIGPLGFLLLYFVGGFLGDLVYVHNNVGNVIPSVGASGCISAIAGAYCLMFYDRSITLRVMLLIFTLTTFSARAFWVVLLWFGMDVWMTMSTSGQMMGSESVNYVAHGIGFICGALFGVLARAHGVMHRYERLPEGGVWFGYWSDGLGRRGRRPRQTYPRK